MFPWQMNWSYKTNSFAKETFNKYLKTTYNLLSVSAKHLSTHQQMMNHDNYSAYKPYNLIYHLFSLFTLLQPTVTYWLFFEPLWVNSALGPFLWLLPLLLQIATWLTSSSPSSLFESYLLSEAYPIQDCEILILLFFYSLSYSIFPPRIFITV